MEIRGLVVLILVLLAGPLGAQEADEHARAEACPSCAEWNATREPFRVFGNTYYVGTAGLAAVLVTSDSGHVLIDGGLPESAEAIAANIRALGFRVGDVRLILNSHAHFDHAGGMAALQRASGAVVAASPWSADVLEGGESVPGDPQHGVLLSFPPVPHARRIGDGEVLRVGPLALTARFTGGHTPGGTTWTWRSCEGTRCVDVVYADSQTPISADGFRFTSSATYPEALADFERARAVLEEVRCDLLLTPHPGASGLWDRLEAREGGARDALLDPDACRRYADTARKQLERRIAAESERP